MSNLSRSLRPVAVGIFLPVLMAACNKHRDTPATPPATGVKASMVGDWHIENVTTNFYNTDGSLRPGSGQVYPGQPDYFYHFNADNSWQESFTPDVTSGETIAGTYSLTSDSTFIMKNPAAVPADADITCKILSLSPTAFTFSRRRSTLFNGTEPGFIDYIVVLKK